MNQSSTRIIHKDDLPEGGFAGIIETRMLMNPRVWGGQKDGNAHSTGMGGFIYLASGYFKPNTGSDMHPHRNIDIVSFILNGSVGHEGTMGHGTTITGPGVQVQRTGAGIQHREFSLTNDKADLVQMWFLPPQNGLQPGYTETPLEKGKMVTVLGGNTPDTFDNAMTCQIGLLATGDIVKCNHPFIAFVTSGIATANGLPVTAGDLIEGPALELSCETECGLVLVQFTETLNT